MINTMIFGQLGDNAMEANGTMSYALIAMDVQDSISSEL